MDYTYLLGESLNGEVKFEERSAQTELRILRSFHVDSAQPAANVLDYDHAQVAQSLFVRYVQNFCVREIYGPAKQV